MLRSSTAINSTLGCRGGGAAATVPQFPAAIVVSATDKRPSVRFIEHSLSGWTDTNQKCPLADVNGCLGLPVLARVIRSLSRVPTHDGTPRHHNDIGLDSQLGQRYVNP